jgi:cytochrome P450
MTDLQPGHAECPIERDFVIDRGNDLAPLATVEESDLLRERHDVFYSPEADGYYVLTRQEDILSVLQDATTFSSRRLSPNVPNPGFDLIPITMDPPVHTKWRHVLAGYFSPRRIERMDDKIRQVAIDLIESVRAQGECDFVRDFGTRFPAAIFLDILGLPIEETDRFLDWVNLTMRGPNPDDPSGAAQVQAQTEVMQYIHELVIERQANPDPERDDIISQAGEWRIDGVAPSDTELLLCCLTLYQAGLDTVNSELGYFFHHLATHPEDRTWIVRDPEIIPNAVEELLRAYPIVRAGREATRDVEVAGCPLRDGDVVLLPTMSAGRDDRAYDDATSVRFDRDGIRHLTFGAGPHRCVGSHLARRELIVALEEWHRRIPDYELADPSGVVEHSGQVCGLLTLPLRWTP